MNTKLVTIYSKKHEGVRTIHPLIYAITIDEDNIRLEFDLVKLPRESDKYINLDTVKKIEIEIVHFEE